MSQQLLIAVMAGLGGMLGWGLADFFAKKTIDQIGDIVTLTWGHLFGTLALFVIALVEYGRGVRFVFPTSGTIWLGLILFGIAQAAVYLFVYKGFGKGQIAVLNPVFASFSGLTALMSIIFFKEAVSGYLSWGLVCIFIGIFLISVDFKALRSRRINFSHIPGLREVVLATILAAFWTLFWDKFIGGQDWLFYTLVMYTVMTLVIFIVSKLQHLKLWTVKPGLWIFLILIGVCETLAYLSISIGYSTTSYTSTVALLSGAFSLPVIVLARLFLKEKISASQTVGGLVIIAGIMLIAVI